MSHDKHTASNWNRDWPCGMMDKQAMLHYVGMAASWQDPFPAPQVYSHDVYDRTFHVVREDLLEVGSKARFGSLLIQRLPKRGPIVYVAPRFGFAGISLAYLAKMYGRELILFMPACKRISEHQAVAIEMGAKPMFYRIAAMPNLNKVAKEWAEENRGHFIPLGLKHELVTACIVRTAIRVAEEYELGDEFWTAMSTGVLSRGLQIAWPRMQCRGVAVARNIQEGERGRADIYSCPKEFAQDADMPPPFPSASNYDAKVWSFMAEHAPDKALFWNVAGNISPKNQSTFDINSNAPWGKLLIP
jgi:hypothetical protein